MKFGSRQSVRWLHDVRRWGSSWRGCRIASLSSRR